MCRKRATAELIAAAIQGDDEAINALITDGADVNEADSIGCTALHYASVKCEVGAVNDFIEAGANIHASDSMGCTPLHFAANEYRLAAAQALLEAGALVDAENAGGNTPLSMAVLNSLGRGEMVLLLREHGADVDYRNERGVAPVRVASRLADYNIAKWGRLMGSKHASVVVRRNAYVVLFHLLWVLVLVQIFLIELGVVPAITLAFPLLGYIPLFFVIAAVPRCRECACRIVLHLMSRVDEREAMPQIVFPSRCPRCGASDDHEALQLSERSEPER